MKEQQNWEERYWDQVVPSMPNVNHTPALDFIRQERKDLLEGIKTDLIKNKWKDYKCEVGCEALYLQDAISIVERHLKDTHKEPSN